MKLARMSYPGSKAQAGTWQRIIGQMPPHTFYVEAFAGSAQIFRRKRPAAASVLIDADAGVSASLAAEDRQGCRVIQGDALAVLPTLTLTTESLVYCDPPYVLSTRGNRRYYHHEMTDDQHAALLALLHRLPCKVMISGYPSPLYSSQLQGWRCLSYATRTRGRTVIECLWMNFPEPTELHDWRFAGRNFRERQALSKMRRRWLAKLARLPARKRGYLLDAIRSTV